MEHKSFCMTDLQTSSEGCFEGYASTFGIIDLDNDLIHKGAFTKTLKNSNNKTVLLYQHKKEEPIGIVTLYQDNKGLKASGQINLEVQKGKEVYSLIKQGALNSMSIGFISREEDVDKHGVRHLKEVELYEVSIVTFPANPTAQLTSIKANSQDLLNLFDQINFKLKELLSI